LPLGALEESISIFRKNLFNRRNGEAESKKEIYNVLLAELKSEKKRILE
jgi:hypothetical protein